MSKRLILAFAVLLGMNTAARAEPQTQRVALIIGQSNYPDANTPLPTTVNDARTLADEFRRLDFEVSPQENLGKEQMRRAIDAFLGKITNGVDALFYFGGYGLQAGRRTYLIPVDAQIWSEADVIRDGFSIDDILSDLSRKGARVKIVLIDASRRNPFERRFRSSPIGLAPLGAPEGTLALFSAAPGAVITDPEDGRSNSVFVSELVKEVRSPNQPAEQAFNRTRIGVSRASSNEIVPWVASSLLNDFYFIPSSGGSTLSQTSPPKPVATPPQDPPARVASASPTSTAAPERTTAAAPTPLSREEKTRKAALDQKIADNSRDASALFERGQMLARHGDYAGALADFNSLVDLDARNADAFNNRCFVHAVRDELQQGMVDCNEALRLRPNFIDALDSRGQINLRLGDLRAAIRDYDAALKIDPRFSSSLYGRGLAKRRSGANADADKDFRLALSIDPQVDKDYASYGLR